MPIVAIAYGSCIITFFQSEMVTVIFAVLEVLFRTLTTVVKLLWMLYINFYKELESTLIS